MNRHIRYLQFAAAVSIHRKDDRRFFHGAVCVRKDGAIVYSYNGNPRFPDRRHHAEYRCARKSDVGGYLYVARTDKRGSWALSKPCESCIRAMASAGIERCYYTIAPEEYGVMVL